MPTPRIHILFAREANKALIMRRGPSKWVQLINWDLSNDTFHEGHWLKGRIYEHRSDLSPDGKYLIYFASKYHLGYENKGYKSTFTAISKPPFLTALALWPVGHTWYGGGYFESNSCVNLNLSAWYQPHEDHQPHQKLEVKYQEDRHFYPEKGLFEITQRLNGWLGLEEFDFSIENGFQGDSIDNVDGEAGDLLKGSKDALQKRMKGNAKGDYFLKRTINFNKLPLAATYCLFHRQRGKIKEVESVVDEIEFADWDRQGRLILVKAGKIYVSKAFSAYKGEDIVKERIHDLEPVIDLNDNRPKSFPPPDSAKIW